MSSSTQITHRPWQRRVAWTLVAALANPLAFVPLSVYSSAAAARDTDIYLSTVYAGSTAEPAIMLILDTSDSMNIPEAWREYPGDYDSHVEYLWNDINVISSTISTDAAPKLTPYASWSGDTLTARQALRTAAMNYANATEPGDPGARSIYRNYDNANWIYWLPAGSPESDKRLWSNAFNRWAGAASKINWPGQIRGGIDYGAANTQEVNNKCSDSLDKLLPSTVFAPTTYPQNTGKYLNQQWQRWEPYLDLRNGRISDGDTTYPDTLGATQVPSSGTLLIISGSAVGAVGANIRARSEFTGTAGGVSPYAVRDSFPRSAPFGNVNNIGDQGQPIRTRIDTGTANVVDSGDSRSGWTDLKADLGGFTFQSAVNAFNTTQLANVLGLYDITATATKAKHKAWKGNRDSTGVPFGMVTGTPAYYDDEGRTLKLNSVTTTSVELCRRTCAVDADPGTAGNQGVYNATNSGAPPRDASGTLKYWVKAGATCQSTGTSGSDCSTLPPACPAIANQTPDYKLVDDLSCQWYGRSSIYIESVGTYYYGGSCIGNCNSAGGGNCQYGNSSTNYCSMTASDVTIGNTTYPQATLGVGATGTSGPSNFCADKSDTITTCDLHESSSGCHYVPFNSNSSLCPDQTTVQTTTTPGTAADYTVYTHVANTPSLAHDCKADNGASGGYMSTATDRTFNTAWNATNSASGKTAAYTPSDPAVSYPAVDMYSVNYLNWKFGPKGPGGQPIGRKTRLQIAKDSLVSLITVTNGIRFGLMVYNKLPSIASGVQLTEGSQGGNVAYAIRRMGSGASDPDYANRASLAAVINGVTATGTTPLTEVSYEAYLYFRGETPLFGTKTTEAAVGGIVSAGADPAAISSGVYVSPMRGNPTTTNPAACQKNYIVLVSDGGPQNDIKANTQIKALSQSPPYRTDILSTQQGTNSSQLETASALPYGPTDGSFPSDYVWLDELTYYMANGDMSPGGATGNDSLPGIQSVSTFTIGFAGGSSPVLQNAALRGNGQYYEANDSAALAGALSAAVNTIRAWNPTGAAPSVPLSATNRSQSADEVYLAFFGPRMQQRWDGTLKKYKLSTDADACNPPATNAPRPIGLCLVDTTQYNIEQYTVDETTGETSVKIRDDAVSYWSGTADGGFPNQGGTGYVRKTTNTPSVRKLYTHLSTSSSQNLIDNVNALTEGNSSITGAMLGGDDASRAKLINFARGADPADSACSDADAGTACSAWRAWPHGDVLHSSPATIAYDSSTVYVYYLSNDGILHAVDTANGQEVWAFMPEEALAQVNAMLSDAVGENLAAADGSPVIYAQDIDGDGTIRPDVVPPGQTDKAYLVFGLRRGGRAYYAIDITDKAAPKLMWKIDNATSGFSELGQSWSTPAFASLRASADPVLVFAGGYDPIPNDQISATLNRFTATTLVTADTPVDHGYASGETVTVSGATQSEYNGSKTITVTGPRRFTYEVSGSPLSPATGSIKVGNNRPANMGRGVFFVNAVSGDLLHSFTHDGTGANSTEVSTMAFSIPSAAVPLNIDLDGGGYADRLYLGDMGGNVWRFDIDDADRANWTAHKFANLSNGATPLRKIFFPPAVVKQQYFGQRFDAVYVGTGDRENPLRQDNTDMLFMVKDFDTGLTTNATATIDFTTSGFYDVTPNLIQTLATGDTSATDTATVAQHLAARTAITTAAGWYMTLEGAEKVVNTPQVFFNVLHFGTYSPIFQASACVPAGAGRQYAMSAIDGSIVVDTNFDGTVSLNSDKRFYADFITRGFPSEGTIVIRNGTIWELSGSGGGATRAENIGKAGVAQRAYWYQEPEQ